MQHGGTIAILKIAKTPYRITGFANWDEINFDEANWAS